MKSFLRAVKTSLRYHLLISAIFLSSLVVALLWGVNIGAVYPFVKVIFDGHSMHEWIDNRIVELEKDRHGIVANIKLLRTQDTLSERDRELCEQEDRLKVKQLDLRMSRLLAPYIKVYLPQDRLRTIIVLAGFVFVGTVVKTMFLVINLFFVEKLAQRTVMVVRNALYEHTLRMELVAFRKENTGVLMSHFSADTHALSSGLTTLYGKGLREPLKIVSCGIGAALISWKLLVILLVICPVPMCVMYLLAKVIKKSSRRALEQTSHFYERLSETFRSIQVVKAFSTEKFEQRRFMEATHRLYRRMLRVTLYGGLARSNNEILGVGVLCLAIVAGGYIVIGQQTTLLGIKIADEPMSLPALMAFFGFLIGMSDPAKKLVDLLTPLQRSAAAAERIYRLMDRQPAIQSPKRPRNLPSGPFGVKFDNVTFHYDPREPLLVGFDLTIRPEETLAVVGPNGCGKSTLVNLIPRFVDPVAGSILLNDVDLRKLTITDLRRRIGYVTQQTDLFQESIVDNIRYGSTDATNEQVVEAAKKAFAHQFIEQQMDQGYQTLVGEGGGRLSGGQRQRIALARAILRDPEILLLDEATSQVDLESEQLIHQALREFIRNRTTIIITHRASTLALADRILVLDSRRIADLGTHDELVSRCELYGRLYHHDLKKSA